MVTDKLRHHGALHRHGVLEGEAVVGEGEAAEETTKFLGETLTIMSTDTMNRATLSPNQLMASPVAVEVVAHILVLLVAILVGQTLTMVRGHRLVAVGEVVGEDVSKGTAVPIDTDTVETMVVTKVRGGEATRKTENPLVVDMMVITSMASLQFDWLLRVVGETSAN